MTQGWPARIGASFMLVLALAAGALVAAHFGWRAFGPAPLPTLPAASSDPLSTILASGLWSGGTATESAPATRTEPANRLAGDLRLLGVMAERDGGGWALFRLPEGPRLVARGQDVSEGVRLTSVRPDGVTLRDSGGERTLALRVDVRPAVPAPGAATVPPVSTANVTRVATRNPACVPPAGFRGPILRVNAELFQGIVAQPESWSALVAADRGALVVRGDSGFINMLSMKKLDRLEQANGIALAAPDDIVGAVLKPLAGNQPVRITGVRDGKPREWLLLNAGTCPA